MVKKVLFFIIPFIAMLTAGFSQTPGKFIHQNKEYYVYPFRNDNFDGVPLVSSKIPDGNYVIFENYTFKTKFSFKREKKHVLDDTTSINAFITVKNNVANGPAVFFRRNYYRGKKRNAASYTYSGNFINGLKDGVWKSVTGSGDDRYTLTTYKNGIRDGYEYEHDWGYLSKKAKYCNGDECDTVFIYGINGLREEYDICPNADLKIEPGIYTDAINRLEGILGVTPKTYYKSYDYSGKNELDLKFRNGTVLPFDSLGLYNYVGLTYVTVKPFSNNQLLLTVSDSASQYTQLYQGYYTGNFTNKTMVKYTYINRKKKLFRKTRQTKFVTRQEESVYTDPATIDPTSEKPVVLNATYRMGDTVIAWYIPKYKFRYEDRGNISFHYIDTSRQWIYLKEEAHPFRSAYTRTDLDLYIEEDKKNKRQESYNPHLLKEFLLDDQNYDFLYEVQQQSDLDTDVEEKPYSRTTMECLYAKNDIPLNGNYKLSTCRKSAGKNTAYTFIPNWQLDNQHSIGRFENGKKEGTWKYLNCEDDTKTAPADYYAWFMKHPKESLNYSEMEYKNGMLNGKYISYEKETRSSRSHPKKSEIKLFQKDEIYYTNDSMNGPYKSYYYDGKIEKEGNYSMDRMHGLWKEYFLTGNLYTAIEFNNGSFHGSYTKYHTDGSVAVRANFNNNLLKDSMIYYYSYTKKPMLCIYAHNDTLTKRVSYFNSGQLKEELIFDANSSYKLYKETISSESFIEILNNYTNNDFRNASGQFKNYYDNGQILSEGAIKDGMLSGPWTFYSINGVAIHKVNFADTTILLPGSTDPVEVAGFYTGYYVAGKKRCEGYIKDLELSFDCFTKQDKANLDFYITSFYDIEGKQTVTNGTGQFIKFDANGSRMAMGRLINCIEDSLWRYYTPDQKLTEIGHYLNGKKNGVWFIGDLEGINFEDGACFDLEDPDAKKAFLEKQKELRIDQVIYQNGEKIQTYRFSSDLNKEYKPKGFHHAIRH